MLRWIGVAIGVTFLGCSSSSGGGSCTSSATCGGNITGTWNVTQACETASVTPSSGLCAAETVQAGPVTISGTATFNSDMTYTIALNESVTETLSIPASCLTVAGTTLTCAELSETINGAEGSDAGGPEFSCSTAGSGCTCTIIDAEPISESGTYATSGSTLTTTPSSGGGGSANYCVSGNSLHVISVDTSADGGMTTGTEFVATK